MGKERRGEGRGGVGWGRRGEGRGGEGRGGEGRGGEGRGGEGRGGEGRGGEGNGMEWNGMEWNGMEEEEAVSVGSPLARHETGSEHAVTASPTTTTCVISLWAPGNAFPLRALGESGICIVVWTLCLAICGQLES